MIAFYQFTDIVREQEEWDRDNFSKDEPKEEWENPYFGFPQMIRFAFNPNEIPVDMSLLDIDAIRAAIERENELGSKAGLTIKGADGDGDDMDTPDDTEPTDTTGTTDTPTGTDTPTDETSDTTQAEEKTKDAVKQFRSYYARILFFAFLTKNTLISLSDIIDCIDEPNNARIARNLGISKVVLHKRRK